VSSYRIVRDDGQNDDIAGQCFASYDEAHAVLERYYADLCCSDDREYYRIEAVDPTSGGVPFTTASGAQAREAR
jgi:hypothetical protein